MSEYRLFYLLSVFYLVAGCTVQPQRDCPIGMQAMVSDTLYFGTAMPEGSVVSDEDWSQFVDSIVTPLFSRGLSFWPASGQWQSQSGAILVESSYVLNLVHPEDETSETAVNEIIDTYKTEFSQEAVMRIKENSCVSY